jgi:hypothetical protein
MLEGENVDFSFNTKLVYGSAWVTSEARTFRGKNKCPKLPRNLETSQSSQMHQSFNTKTSWRSNEAKNENAKVKNSNFLRKGQVTCHLEKFSQILGSEQPFIWEMLSLTARLNTVCNIWSRKRQAPIIPHRLPQPENITRNLWPLQERKCFAYLNICTLVWEPCFAEGGEPKNSQAKPRAVECC